MSQIEVFGEVTQEIPGHPLLPEGIRFPDDDHPVITDWADVLPPLEFSVTQFRKVRSLAEGHRTLFDDERVVVLSRVLMKAGLAYSRDLGCWQLPIPNGLHWNGSPKYPAINSSELDYRGTFAHRASLEVFMGVKLLRGYYSGQHVDHRCRTKNCCNPYHLEAVEAVENHRRGHVARRAIRQPRLWQAPAGRDLTYADLVTS